MSRSIATAAVFAAAWATACSPKPSEPAAPAPAAPAPAPAAGSDAPSAAASASRVVTERFHSDALGVDKAVVIYLPRGYDSEPAKKWPVFYYLHGLGGNETNWIKGGHLDTTADHLALAAIVVMPDGDDSFYANSPAPIDYDRCLADGTGMFFPTHEKHETSCVRARNYDTYITKDLVGWIDAHYHTLARRDGRAIAGLSMGGFGAMQLSMRHPDEFAAAASQSGGIALLYSGPHPYVAGRAELLTDVSDWGRRAGPIGEWIHGLFGSDIANWRAYDVVELAQKLPPGKVALYFDCGSEDEFGLEDNLQYVHEALAAKHIPHEFFIGPGHHDFDFWAARLPHSLAFLRDHTAKPE